MSDFYTQQMYNDPRYLEMMKRKAMMNVPDYQLNTPGLSMMPQFGDSARALTNTPTTGAGGMTIPDYQLSSPSITPNALQNIDTSGGNAAGALTSNPAAAGTGWGTYAGLGAMAAAPVAAALLGKKAPDVQFAPAASLGSKPMIQIQNPYGQPQQRMPAFLARLLMGATGAR